MVTDRVIVNAIGKVDKRLRHSQCNGEVGKRSVLFPYISWGYYAFVSISPPSPVDISCVHSTTNSCIIRFASNLMCTLIMLLVILTFKMPALRGDTSPRVVNSMIMLVMYVI